MSNDTFNVADFGIIQRLAIYEFWNGRGDHKLLCRFPSRLVAKTRSPSAFYTRAVAILRAKFYLIFAVKVSAIWLREVKMRNMAWDHPLLCNLSHSKEGFPFGNCCKLITYRILLITSVFHFRSLSRSFKRRWTPMNIFKKFLHYGRNNLRTDNSWTMSNDIHSFRISRRTCSFFIMFSSRVAPLHFHWKQVILEWFSSPQS